MTTISEIYEYLCELAPLELQMDFDNSGFQIGRADKAVEKVLLSLDITDAVVSEADAIGAGLIISHHPLIFRAIKTINGSDPEGERLLRLAEKGIAAISMHTNLDIVQGGVNDVLLEILGAESQSVLDSLGCGRVGILPKAMSLDEFLDVCREKLIVNGLRYYNSGKPVYKLAVMGGAGGDNLEDAYRHGCDTYVTADIKYHQFLRAQELGINLIDADHFCTENPVMYYLRDKLSDKFPELEFVVTEKHEAIISFA